MDLFSLTAQQSGGRREDPSNADSGIKAVLDNLPELWEEEQYSEEYNMDTFISNMKKWNSQMSIRKQIWNKFMIIDTVMMSLIVP